MNERHITFYLPKEDLWIVRALEMRAQLRERAGTPSSRNNEVREILRKELQPWRAQILGRM